MACLCAILQDKYPISGAFRGEMEKVAQLASWPGLWQDTGH